MAKTTSSRKSNTNAPRNNTGRTRPMPYKAGVTKNRTRYEQGGNWCW